MVTIGSDLLHLYRISLCWLGFIGMRCVGGDWFVFFSWRGRSGMGGVVKIGGVVWMCSCWLGSSSSVRIGWGLLGLAGLLRIGLFWAGSIERAIGCLCFG